MVIPSESLRGGRSRRHCAWIVAVIAWGLSLNIGPRKAQEIPMEFCVNASWMANLCILRLLLLSPLHLVLDPCFLFDFIWFNAPWKTAISKQTPYLRCANLENFDKSQGRRTISLFPARCIRAAAGQRSWGDLVQNGPEWSRIPDFPPGRWNPFSFFRFFGNSDGDLHFYLWDILGSHSEHVGAWETKLIRWFLPFSTQSQDSRPSLCCALVWNEESSASNSESPATESMWIQPWLKKLTINYK